MSAWIIFSLADNFYMSQKIRTRWDMRSPPQTVYGWDPLHRRSQEFAPQIARKWMVLTMTIPNSSSEKRIAVQIRTSSGDAIEAWVYRPPKEILLAAAAGITRR
jgi:hypothetical protein